MLGGPCKDVLAGKNLLFVLDRSNNPQKVPRNTEKVQKIKPQKIQQLLEEAFITEHAITTAYYFSKVTLSFYSDLFNNNKLTTP